MTKTQFCKNCKHLGLDGMFGLICEVNGNNKNHDCKKYEENGDKVTAKRFTETLSTGIVTDHITGKGYKCEMRIDDELLKLLNELHEENQDLKSFNEDLAENLSACANARISKDDWIEKLTEENEQLKQQLKSIEDSFKFNYTENHAEFNKDKLIVKDTHTKIHLDGRNLFIKVYIPQIDEFYRFKYTITGKSLMREFIENYNPKGDME